MNHVTLAFQHNLSPGAPGAEASTRLIKFKEALGDRSGKPFAHSIVKPVRVIDTTAFDATQYVAYGSVEMGIISSEALMEMPHAELYAPLDFGPTGDRLSVLAPRAQRLKQGNARSATLRIATQFPNIVQRHFDSKGVAVECIALQEAVIPALIHGLCDLAVTVINNDALDHLEEVVEVEMIGGISAKLIVNRTAMKRRPEVILPILDRAREALAR